MEDYVELLDVALALSNRFDTHWTLFISVHLALIGGIIYVDRPLDNSEKLAAIVVYTGFAVFNGLMMMNQLKLLHSLYLDIISLESHACCMHLESLKHIKQVNERASLRLQHGLILGVHVIMYTLVVISILRDKARSS